MKKYIAALSLGTYLSLASSAFATTGGLCPQGTFAPLCNVSLTVFIGAFISLVFIVAVIVALFYLIYGGFRWLVSGGDKAAVQAARDHIVAAVIGLVIIFLSYFILNFLIGFFIPGFSITTFNIPHL